VVAHNVVQAAYVCGEPAPHGAPR